MYAHDPFPQQQRMERSMSQKKRDQAAARKEFNNDWQTGLCGAPCADPAYCCFALFCATCAAYEQRKLQMGSAWPSQYVCCNGGTCVSGRCGERSNPELCLCCEVCCCFPSAMATTRFMIQDEQRVMNTQCDNCLIGFMLITQQLAFCLRCLASVTNNQDIELLADAVDCLADLTYASVCACMLTQQNLQIKHRNSQQTQGRPGVMSAPTPPTMQPGRPSAPVVLTQGPPQPQPMTYVYTAPPRQAPPPRAPPARAQPHGQYTTGSTYYPE